MRCILNFALVMLAAAPAVMRADVTIRYTSEVTSGVPGIPVQTSVEVIYMKGNKGATVQGAETTIMDFARGEVTLLDSARKKYATIPASEYGDKVAARMRALAPPEMGTPAIADMMKKMKTACDTKNNDVAEMIQGVHAIEREVDCTMTIDMPANMPAMGTKISTRVWLAAPSERLRVPGLWQLSGFELWQNTFMNPTGGAAAMAPEGMKPMMEALRKDQSATLRLTTEVTMQMPMAMPGMLSGDKPMMTSKREMTGLSTELLDDALFSVPSDFTAETFEAVMGQITDAQLASVKTEVAEAEKSQKAAALSGTPSAPKPAIAENVKAYVPKLVPLTDSEPKSPKGADGKALQGFVDLLVTVGPSGKVERAEVVGGPEGLRKTAVEAVEKWTYRPVLRDGVAVPAYTDASVDFTDESAADGGFEFTSEMADAAIYFGDLEEKFPRTPQQKLADLEQDSGGGSKERRYDRVDEMAVMAVKAGANDRAKAYATELLAGITGETSEAHRTVGDGIHDGHLVLGLVALRNGDVPVARQELVEAGKTPGSPWLKGFGPNMALAKELLQKGERNIVLDYFELCRKFWTLGGERLDAWTAAVRKGEMPDFGDNISWGETDERR